MSKAVNVTIVTTPARAKELHKSIEDEIYHLKNLMKSLEEMRHYSIGEASYENIKRLLTARWGELAVQKFFLEHRHLIQKWNPDGTIKSMPHE